jgi:hypothetical protein
VEDIDVKRADAKLTESHLQLLHAGRETDPEYFEHLERFFVLIDRRTGLSDAGGVWTIQMPDIVVALFTAARQSLYGARDVMRLAQSARQRLAYDRRSSMSCLPRAASRETVLATQIRANRVCTLYVLRTTYETDPTTNAAIVHSRGGSASTGETQRLDRISTAVHSLRRSPSPKSGRGDLALEMRGAVSPI